MERFESNGGQVGNDYLKDSAERLVGVLKGIPDRNQLIQTAWLAVFSRQAQQDEVEAITKYLAAREDRPALAIQQFIWALVAGSEFRFNY